MICHLMAGTLGSMSVVLNNKQLQGGRACFVLYFESVEEGKVGGNSKRC